MGYYDRYDRYDRYGWRPYVSAASRQRQAQREMERLKQKGHPVSPVVIAGAKIARTFWGQAWCQNLEGYSDYSNRLPRGRAYVRNGSVVDLQIAPGEIKAMVSGSDLYKVAIQVSAVPKARWRSICVDCAGAIDSLVELLQGRFSKGVMERLCQQKTGLFPAPAEIELSCSCPDWATMCKHVAAVLYGIGARLDEQPELLFKLRRVDEQDLIAGAGKGLPLSKKGPAAERVLAAGGLSELFGLELGQAGVEPAPGAARAAAKTVRSRRAPKPTVATRAKSVAKPAPIAALARAEAKAKAKAAAGRAAARARKTTVKAKARPQAQGRKRSEPQR